MNNVTNVTIIFKKSLCLKKQITISYVFYILSTEIKITLLWGMPPLSLFYCNLFVQLFYNDFLSVVDINTVSWVGYATTLGGISFISL